MVAHWDDTSTDPVPHNEHDGDHQPEWRLGAGPPQPLSASTPPSPPVTKRTKQRRKKPKGKKADQG
jgi:hypothetical protein